MPFRPASGRQSVLSFHKVDIPQDEVGRWAEQQHESGIAPRQIKRSQIIHGVGRHDPGGARVLQVVQSDVTEAVQHLQ